MCPPGADTRVGPYVPVKLHFQVRARNHLERHAVRLPILGFDQHLGAVDAAQLALEEPLAIDFLAHHDLCAPAGEAAVVVGPAQRSIQAGRRDFQRVGGRHHVFHIEDGAQIAADPRTILDAHALFRRRPGTRPIDAHPQHHALGFAAELHVEDLEPVARCDPGRRVPYVLDDVCHFGAQTIAPPPENKKSGHMPTRFFT